MEFSLTITQAGLLVGLLKFFPISSWFKKVGSRDFKSSQGRELNRPFPVFKGTGLAFDQPVPYSLCFKLVHVSKLLDR